MIARIFRKTWLVGKLVVATAILQMSFPASAADDAAPPSRVARLNYLDGTVTFSPAGTDDWSVARANRPLTIGDRVWADKGARSELHVGSTAMRLGASTSLELLDLSDDDAQLKVTQGTFSIRVREMDRDDNIEIDTPNLAFVIREPGEYRFDVDPDRDTTLVTVRRGSGRAYGSDADQRSVEVRGNRQLNFSGDDLFYSYSGEAPPRDSFDRWAAERDSREDQSRSARYVSRDMTGYEELDDNGEWRDEPEYGPVWVPRVTVRNWAPYHYGHWAWIAPWGWTWVDDEPWGFAPFHYGRWAHIRGHWAWVPGPIARRPVYAPALVGFVGGGGNGVSWGVSISIGTPGVAWFALAPGEHYRPAYTSNPTYITNINRTIVVNRSVVHNVYVNQRIPHAIAAMPARDFVRGQPARGGDRGIHEDKLREFSRMPSASSLPIAPVRQSLRGADRASPVAPPARTLEHAVVARRQAPEAPAFHDALARRFAEQKGVVPGAGPVFTPVSRPEPRPVPTRAGRPDASPRQVADEAARGRGQEQRDNGGNRDDRGRRAEGGDMGDIGDRGQRGGPRPDTNRAEVPRPPMGRSDEARRDGRNNEGAAPRAPRDTAATQEMPRGPQGDGPRDAGRDNPRDANVNGGGNNNGNPRGAQEERRRNEDMQRGDVARPPFRTDREMRREPRAPGGERRMTQPDMQGSTAPAQAPVAQEPRQESRRRDERPQAERPERQQQERQQQERQQQEQQRNPERMTPQVEPRWQMRGDMQRMERARAPEPQAEARPARPAEEQRVSMPSTRAEPPRNEQRENPRMQDRSDRPQERPQQAERREERPQRPEHERGNGRWGDRDR